MKSSNRGGAAAFQAALFNVSRLYVVGVAQQPNEPKAKAKPQHINAVIGSKCTYIISFLFIYCPSVEVDHINEFPIPHMEVLLYNHGHNMNVNNLLLFFEHK